MRLLLGSFIGCMGDLPNHEKVLSSILPPLGRLETGFGIDCSLLLAADVLVYDKDSLDLLKQYATKETDNICESIHILGDSGFIELEDFRGSAAPILPLVEQAVLATTDDYSKWVPHIQRQIDTYNRIVPELRAQFPSSFSNWDTEIFGISDYLLKETGGVNPADATHLRAIVKSTRKRRRAAGENELVRKIIQPGVRAVYTNLHIASELNCIPYSWVTLAGYYDQALVLAARNYSEEHSQLQKCREFFDVAFPQFQPRDTREWVALLTHPKVEDLRKRIAEAIESEENIDANFAQRAMSALIQDKDRLARRKEMSASIALPVSLAGGVAGGVLGGILGGIGGSALPSLVQYLVDKHAERKLMSRHGWMYFASNE